MKLAWIIEADGPKFPARPGWYVRCPNEGKVGSGYNHTRSNGPKLTRAKCAECGGELYSSPTYWGVIQWTGTGHYDPADVVSWHRSAEEAWAAANARTDDGGQGGWVDRSWPVEDLKRRGLL